MAKCPMCGSGMYSRRSFPNLLDRTFVCEHCKFKIKASEMKKRGGMDNVKRGIERGASRKRKPKRRNPRSSRNSKSRGSSRGGRRKRR